MKIKFLKLEAIEFKNPIIVSIMNLLKAQTEYEPGVLYDTLSKVRILEEAKNLLSALSDGNQFKATYILGNNSNIENLIVNIGSIYCPVTKDHGKMILTNFKIENKAGKQYLKVTYKCMHPKCRAKRFIDEYLPRLWKESKELLKNIRLVNVKPT